MTAKPFDRRSILKNAHWTAHVRVASGARGTYREHLSAALKFEWARAKQFRAAAAARLSQNVGFPLRSCFADAARSPARFRTSQFVARALAG
ncbi:hypothetical protein IY145_17830 [Methylosinus sp. H3A]|uniref:hypothetical protein n=1 Tax=Methylosinus sp. H3A TaxID=2785786 RepID=UPI0018C26C37|nr:hypothetical protein [Methylosinus sp. H3A]MBG0811218.1 hypothetical protein [Methylosinus sp. H3A]